MIDPQDIVESVSDIQEPITYESVKPSIEGIVAAENALAAIKQRSFSGRHPELGKMIKCQVCKARHRTTVNCTVTFTTVVDRGPNERTVPERIASQNTAKGVVGAAAFKGKRIKPHFNKRAKALRH